MIIPNEYKLFKAHGQTYMLITWLDESCVFGDNKSYPIIYKKLDSRHYTENDTRTFCDNTDIPFVPDPKLIGNWTACALVRKIEDFSPERKYDPNALYVLGLKVFPRGICVKELRGIKTHNEAQLSYSKGVIISAPLQTAEHYKITELNCNTYLFLEHKSGDYYYGGIINSYYVFRKDK